MEDKVDGGGNGKVPEQSAPPSDFKLCEIWIRDGQLQVDGSDAFWEDKVRALGTFEYCKDIIKYREPPKTEESKIVPVKGEMMNFVRNRFKRGSKR